jgi:hypothetical protein
MHLLVRLILIACCWLSFSGTFAQKVDLDRFSFDYSHLVLPRDYLEPDQRTVGVRINIAPAITRVVAAEAVYDQIKINGFQQTETDPSVGITVTMGDVRFVRSETTNRTEEVKDKDGKVTGRNYFYKLTARYSISGNYRITGPFTDTPAKEPKKVESAAPSKTNRFLTNVVSAPQEPQRKQVSAGWFPVEMVFTSGEFKTPGDAEKYFYVNRNSIQNELITNYVNSAIVSVNTDANRLFGYTPTSGKDFLWILDSKKHPEYEIQQEAIKAVKELMKGMSATESTAQLAINLEPVLAYFSSLKTKYASDEKADKKMRYSAYYSLATLYYYLDQPDKLIDEATGLIKNDYDKKDGERFIEKAQELKKSLEKHHLTERHMAL